jgi:hypothetical protein
MPLAQNFVDSGPTFAQLLGVFFLIGLHTFNRQLDLLAFWQPQVIHDLDRISVNGSMQAPTSTTCIADVLALPATADSPNPADSGTPEKFPVLITFCHKNVCVLVSSGWGLVILHKSTTPSGSSRG